MGDEATKEQKQERKHLKEAEKAKVIEQEHLEKQACKAEKAKAKEQKQLEKQARKGTEEVQSDEPKEE
ncbi:hypothetical protein [Cohnella nanjingensis]|uniref:Uncharacterized protein n=1 Tax=Cohnella nanjingensis TaxID=1387779 RepID=A0A7X0RXA1_9BACL|nr:hypothetical protein [Cohnella nanjingensis]MBB6675374.1 hypothetical protein [Cohnella nanjingensis]